MEEGLLLCVTGIQFVNLKYIVDIGAVDLSIEKVVFHD